jgi:hypothetical protein
MAQPISVLDVASLTQRHGCIESRVSHVGFLNLMKNKTKYVYYVDFHYFCEGSVFVTVIYEISIFIVSVKSIVRHIDRTSTILPASSREIPNSNLGPETDHPDSSYRGYPQFRHENAGLVPQIRQRPLPFASFPVHYLPIIPSFKA